MPIPGLETLADAAGTPITSSNPLATSGAVEGEATAGHAFLAGTGNLALSVAGNARLTIANPAASGVTVYLFRLTVFATAAGFAELYVNPTAGLPAGIRANNNVYVGNSTAAKAVVSADTNTTTALSGGTDSGVALGIPSGARAVFDLPPMVPPAGVTLGINVPFTGAANVTVNAEWYEK